MGCATSRVSRKCIKPMLTRQTMKTNLYKARPNNRWINKSGHSSLPTVFEVPSECECSIILN